jgi:hypothetical protein
MKIAVKVGIVSTAIVALLCIVAGAWLRFAPRRVPTGQPALATLTQESLADFRAAFNRSDGDVRIIAMLSPT